MDYYNYFLDSTLHVWRFAVFLVGGPLATVALLGALLGLTRLFRVGVYYQRPASSAQRTTLGVSNARSSLAPALGPFPVSISLTLMRMAVVSGHLP